MIESQALGYRANSVLNAIFAILTQAPATASLSVEWSAYSWQVSATMDLVLLVME